MYVIPTKMIDYYKKNSPIFLICLVASGIIVAGKKLFPGCLGKRSPAKAVFYIVNCFV
jgi:hypothetical protein